jgi:hypothetical protein
MLLGLSLVSTPASAIVLTYYSTGTIGRDGGGDGLNIFNLGTSNLSYQTFSMTMSMDFDLPACRLAHRCGTELYEEYYQWNGPVSISVTVGGHTFTDYVTTRNDTRAHVENRAYWSGLRSDYVGLYINGYDDAGFHIQAEQDMSDVNLFLGAINTFEELNLERLVVQSQNVKPVTKFSFSTPDNGSWFDVQTTQYMIVTSKPSVQAPEPEPAKVPEPDSILLMSAGLLGMLGFRRSIAQRRRDKSA